MWLKYQQVNAKMASFDPREMMKGKEERVMKHPLKRFEPTLRTTLQVVIPMNLDRLKKHKTNIEKFAHSKNWIELNKEQINATRTVQQLQATLRDLDKMKRQIQGSDLNEFVRRIASVKVESMAAVQQFALLQSVIAREVKTSICRNNDLRSPECYEDVNLQANEDMFSKQLLVDQADDLYPAQLDDSRKTEMEVCQSWDHLRNGLEDLNALVKDFATVVNNQQENVDHIEEHIESAAGNVNSAATFLGQASKYKSVILPVGGAVVGGVIGGPIGLMAGFKLAGVAAAVGGGVVGYQGGRYMKRKYDEKVDIELSHLSNRDTADKKVS